MAAVVQQDAALAVALEGPPPVTAAQIRPARLNPFAFPPETDFRFAQLIVSVVGASLIIFTTLYNTVPATWDWKSAYYARCTAEVQALYPSPSGADLIAMQAVMGQCTAPADRREAAWLGFGALLIAFITGAVYWLLPVLKIRREGLIPLSPEDDPQIVAYLDALSKEAGLAEPPRFLWNPLNLTANGVAFGRRGRYSVALSGGLVVQFHTDRPSFRAVVLHELAHLRNADVDKTYLAVGAGAAFFVVVLAPLVLTMFGKPWGWIFQLSWRVLALAGLVYVTLTAVLRARELYADVRASVWDGPEGALRSVVARQPARAFTGRWNAWRYALKPHPDPAVRTGVLDDTRPLFRMGYWEAFGAGVAATVAFGDVQHLLGLLIPMWGAFLRPLGAALIFAPLAVGVVGLAVWRESFAALLRNERSRGTVGLALAMALGLLLGQHLSFGAFAASVEVTHTGPAQLIPVPLTGAPRLVFDAVWTSLLVAGLVLLLSWIASGASAWLEVTASSGASPRPAYRTGLGLAGLLLAAWLSMLFYAHAVIAWSGDDAFLQAMVPELETVGIPVSAIAQALAAQGVALQKTTVLLLILALGMAVLTAISPMTVVALVSIWAYPLAASVWRRTPSAMRAVRPSWAFLEGTLDGLVTLPAHAPLRPRFALVVGGVGGTLVAALFFALDWLLFNSPSAAASELFALWLLFVQPSFSVLVQGVVAGIVAARVRRLAVVHALFAAFVSGVAIALSLLWFSLQTWGVADPGFAVTLTLSAGWSLNVGGGLALLVALAVSGATRSSRNSRAR